MEKESVYENGTPKISVIVPVYNVEKYLRKCVDSICAQTYTNLEIILVDDGSPDGCPAICDEYAAGDDRIRVIHKPNGGLSSARNAGLDICSGDYIGFVDSDDWIAPEMYEKLYEALVDNDADLSVCELRKYSSEDELSSCSQTVAGSCSLRVYNSDEALSALVSSAPVAFVVACGKLYKRFLFNTIRFPLGKIHEDEFVAHQVLYNCSKIIRIPNYFYNNLINPEGITHSPFNVKRLDAVEARYQRLLFYIDHGLTRHIPEAMYAIDTAFCSCVAQFHPKTEEDFQRLKEIRRMVCEARKLYNGRIPPKQYIKRLFPRLFYFASSLKQG